MPSHLHLVLPPAGPHPPRQLISSVPRAAPHHARLRPRTPRTSSSSLRPLAASLVSRCSAPSASRASLWLAHAAAPSLASPPSCPVDSTPLHPYLYTSRLASSAIVARLLCFGLPPFHAATSLLTPSHLHLGLLVRFGLSTWPSASRPMPLASSLLPHPHLLFSSSLHAFAVVHLIASLSCLRLSLCLAAPRPCFFFLLPSAQPSPPLPLCPFSFLLLLAPCQPHAFSLCQSTFTRHFTQIPKKPISFDFSNIISKFKFLTPFLEKKKRIIKRIK